MQRSEGARQHPRSYPINAEAKAEWEASGPGFEASQLVDALLDVGQRLELDWCWEKIAQLTTTNQIQREHIAQLKMFREGSRL